MLHCGRGQRLLLTGGLGKHPPAEAYVMRQLALAAGAVEARILVEDQATSTFESAVYCARILRQHGWSTALVVTDRYHLPRAVLTFRGLGVQAYGSAAPADAVALPRRRWWYTRCREAPACVWYMARILAWQVQQLRQRPARR
jgi:uncharacterized SAM-binding protein YcdF (DUF218 family)